MRLRLPRAFADAIVEQARREHPNEACGLMAGSDGVASRIYPMTNAERSPVLYRLEPHEQLRVFNEIEDEGLELVAIYHSHTRSPAYPSATDVSLAYYPEAVYLIVSLADPDQPDLRGFEIVDGKVTEVALAVEG
jgi:[CysO sulfur-carrier protein]-S-L-cysteine hydrolase